MDRIELLEKLIKEAHRTTIVHQQYLSKTREYLPGSNLYMREVHFIAAADPKKSVPISDIADKLEITQGAVSQLASRLEEKGFIIRVKNPKDHRKIMVELTDDGNKLYYEHISYDKETVVNISTLLSKFDDTDIEKIIDFEKILREAFKAKI